MGCCCCLVFFAVSKAASKTHFVMLLCLLSTRAAFAIVCPKENGDVPFTKALYDQGKTEYEKATCIADKEFCAASTGWSNCTSSGGDITIENGLPLLKGIGTFAFEWFNGTVRFLGDYPNLETISFCAFRAVQGSGSLIEFKNGLPLLKEIGYDAFTYFQGAVIFQGDYPKLGGIHGLAFFGVQGLGSLVEFKNGLPRLALIGNKAFVGFGGTVKFQGDYPVLRGGWGPGPCYENSNPQFQVCRKGTVKCTSTLSEFPSGPAAPKTWRHGPGESSSPAGAAGSRPSPGVWDT